MTRKNRNRLYSNGTLSVVWQPAECIHAGICFSSLRQVFDPAKRPWVNITAAPHEQIIEVVKRCPTRALTYMWDDAKRNAEDQSDKIFREDLTRLFPEKAEELHTVVTPVHDSPPTKVTLRSGGPMVLDGNFTITFNGSDLRPMKMASLCRCGLSGDQPFCDGAHFKAGFRV